MKIESTSVNENPNSENSAQVENEVIQNPSIVNQEDRPIIIEQILSFYKKSWEDYESDLLREHMEDIKTNLTRNEIHNLTKEQLVNILITNDRNELFQKSYFEIKNELNDYLTKTF